MRLPLLLIPLALLAAEPVVAAEKDTTHDRRSMCEKDWATASRAGTTGGKTQELYVTSCLMGDPKPTQAVRPKGVTGTCNDGTNSSELDRATACKGHGGVATWLKSAAAPPPLRMIARDVASQTRRTEGRALSAQMHRPVTDAG